MQRPFATVCEPQSGGDLDLGGARVRGVLGMFRAKVRNVFIKMIAA